MRLQDPKARDSVDGRPDSRVDVQGDTVTVGDDGCFEHPAIDEVWAESYAERNGFDLGDVLLADAESEDSDGVEGDGVCGTVMSDGSVCERPPDECPYH